MRGPLVEWQAAGTGTIAVADVQTPFNFGLPELPAITQSVVEAGAGALIVVVPWV